MNLSFRDLLNSRRAISGIAEILKTVHKANSLLLQGVVLVILCSACGRDKETERDAALGPDERSATGAAEKPLKHQKYLYPCPRRSRSVDLFLR